MPRNGVRVALLGLLLAACGEGSRVPGGSTGPEEPGPTPAPVPGVVASAPVARTLLGQAGSETVAFIAAPNGTIAHGRGAVLVNRRTGARVDAVVEEGGFDPVALVADDGDVVEVTLTDSAGQVTTTPLAVKRGTKPRVVRTAPEPRATDVPLNSVIRVVFSTPVRASEAAGAIRLFSGGVEVAGAIQENGAADVFVDFVPAAPLAANTAYELRVEASLTDVLGLPLEAGVAVSFTSGEMASAPQIWNLLLPNSGRLQEGESIEVTAVGYCGFACYVALPDVRWSSTSPAIATVTVTGPGRARVSALSPGMTWVVATVGNFEARMDVFVASAAASPVGTGANEIVFASRDPNGSIADSSEVASNLFAIRDDGTGLTQLTSSATDSYGEPSVARDGRIVFVVDKFDHFELAVRERDGTVHPLLSDTPPGQPWVMCPTWSPDASYVAYASSGDGTGTSIRVVRADGSGETVVEISPHRSCPSWSPDGTQLSYGTLSFGMSGGWMTTLNLADVSRFPEVSARDVLTTRSALFGRWSPAGDALVSFVEEGGSIWLERTPLGGGAGLRLARMSVLDCCGIAGTSYVPEWSPDGRLLLFFGSQLVDVSAGWVDWVGGRLPIGADHATFVPAGVSFTR